MRTKTHALEFAVVGLGQAGGNLAAEMQRRGYPALALNTAHTDLSTLASDSGHGALPDERRVYIGIDGYDGAGSDPAYGRECIQASRDRIVEVLETHVEGADVLLITAGLGGGTGSAAAELLKVIRDIEIPTLVLAALPNESESGIAKVNAVRAVNELIREPIEGWIFIDNSRLADAHGDVSIANYYNQINQVIVSPLDAFNKLNEREDVQKIRAFDGEDLRTVLLSRGVLNYTQGSVLNLNADAVVNTVRDAMQYSLVMPGGFALERVSYLGLVIEAPERMLRDTPFSNFEQINEQLKEETGGAAIYSGLYVVPESSAQASLHVICSSQTLPEGIQEMVGDAKREGATIREKLQHVPDSLDLGEIEDYQLFQMTVRHAPGQRRTARARGRAAQPAAPRPAPGRSTAPPPAFGSVRVALEGNEPESASKASHNAPAASEGRGQAAAQAPAEHDPHASEATLQVELDESSVSAGGNSDTEAPAVAGGSDGEPERAEAQSSAREPGSPPPLPEPSLSEQYETLVRDYLDARSEDIRQRIAAKLEADRRSQSPDTRYMAVRAMTQLEGKEFHGSLLAATLDEDEKIRDIAKRALRN